MALSIIISHQLWVGDVVGAEGDHIAFGTDPVCFLFAFYLLNRLVDLDQTCLDILLRGGKEVLVFQ